MSFSLAQILLFIIAYLTGLFAVAHLADLDRCAVRPDAFHVGVGVIGGLFLVWRVIRRLICGRRRVSFDTPGGSIE